MAGTTEDVKWGADLCFCVGGKMYAVTSLQGGAVSLKVPEPVFAGLVRRHGVTPAPYLARHHWVHVEPFAEVTWKELCGLIAGSHALVAAKLPKRRTARR
ncbi:MAG: MmcQ/YjbR family DNA-binding protein [Deltaproteobacteria bacterium]|nr:MmcQ/YjbR family DNA-binding protein [Deltaproteobacteria bacterium]